MFKSNTPIQMKLIRTISNVGAVDRISKIIEDELSERPSGNLVVQRAYHEFDFFAVRKAM